MPEIGVASVPGWIRVRVFISLCFLTIDTMWSVTSYFWPLAFPIMMSCALKLWVQLVSFYLNWFSQVFCQREVACAETWNWLSWGTASSETLWEMVWEGKMWVRLFLFMYFCFQCTCVSVRVRVSNNFFLFWSTNKNKIIRSRHMFECILKENKM